MSCACGCVGCIKDALIKTAGKKRIRDFLTARILMEEALTEDETVYCDVCGEDFDNCEHGGCCEEAYTDGEPDWEYCPYCGTELA